MSIEHIQSASLLSREARDLEAEFASGPDPGVSEKHRAFVVGAVWSSVGCLEAAVNELFADAADEREKRLSSIEPEIRNLMGRMWRAASQRLSTLDKYECALELVGADSLPRGEAPAQDVAHLIALRNALIHFVPETQLAGVLNPKPEDQHKLEKLFASRNLTQNPFTGPGNPFFPDKLLGYGCAAWATEAVIAYADEFFSRLGMAPPYEHVRQELKLEAS